MKKGEQRSNENNNKKLQHLECYKEENTNKYLTTNNGLRVNDDQNSLKTDERGATLMEDHIFREKMTHFDHERIPERVVHARGSGAHGVFQLYESLSHVTKAKFLGDTGKQTPVFVRFSTVQGSKGSTDLARDVRGFATKFYTEEGNFDLVGNNMPVFFIQDAIKFPDLVHALKPEPDFNIPQASTAHDTFWDFISLMPESMHMIMWVMSDRAIPRSYRMMEGFGVHTFRFVNDAGKSTFVKFIWKPLLGVHSVMFNEAQKISGFDPDFHRRDLWDAIESGAFPEYELCVQLVSEDDAAKFDFDILDSTKIIPEELVPPKRIGKMTLNRNPDNFFAETEQVAFHLGHIVPGIDFTDDPLLQGRLFSYLDTQLLRLGGPNFHEIPINRPIAPINNHQKDGFMRQTIKKNRITYEPNSLGGGCPFQAMISHGGYQSYPQPIKGKKVRGRSETFRDHFSQAKLFYNSQSDYEKQHIIDAFRFELGSVKVMAIRQRMVGLIAQVDEQLAHAVAQVIGVQVPSKPEEPMNRSFGADTDPQSVQPLKIKSSIEKSKALSMAYTVKNSIKSRKIAMLVADGFNGKELDEAKCALQAEGAMGVIISTKLGGIKSIEGKEINADYGFFNAQSVMFDAVYVPGGGESAEMLKNDPDAYHFVDEAFRHCKSIAASGEGVQFVMCTFAGKAHKDDEGVIFGNDFNTVQSSFFKSIAKHRNWDREITRKVPA